jgi:hypothetical protein
LCRKVFQDFAARCFSILFSRFFAGELMLIDAIKQHGKKQIEVKQKNRITDKTQGERT